MSNAVQLLEQAEGLLNRGEIAVALGLIGMAKKEAGEGADEPRETLPERIGEQLAAVYHVQALISVVVESMDRDEDFARPRVLDDAYSRLGEVAHALDLIGTDVRRAVSVISDALLVQS